MIERALSRRRFISGSVQVALGSILLNGCGLTVAEVVIPAIAGVTLQELYNFAKTLFKERAYAAGDTLDTLIAELQNVPVQTGQLAADRSQQFKGVAVENGFCTPILLYQRGLSRFLQLAQEGTYWSLLTGGPNNTAVFKVHQTWLKFLIEEDTCNLVINANSSPYEKCGVEGCPITVTRQSFLDVNNVEQKLQKVVPDPSYTYTALERHEKHSERWPGCPVVEGRTEKCV